MKYNHKVIIIINCIILAFFSFGAVAQQETDELNAGDKSFEVDQYPVQLAFRKAEPQNLLGGVSVVNVDNLLTKSYWSLNLDALIGGVDGAVSWGMNDLMVVVDGIPRDQHNVLLTEIDQVTVLKGAAAIALYGSSAAKGVIIITTKRGKQGPMQISVRANSGVHVPKSYPKYLGAAEYMTLYNEARTNDDLSPLYTQEEIYHTAVGTNPYRYPDLNFYNSEYLKKVYNRSEAMAEVSGGNEIAQYYTTMGYLREGSILNVGNTKDDNTTRMFVRGNIDMKLHELIKAYVDANVTFYDANAANTNFWSGAATLRPNRVAPLIPLSYIDQNDEAALDLLKSSGHIINGNFLGGTVDHPTNPIADAYAAGKGKWVSRQFQFNGGMDFHIRGIAEGLYFRGKYGMDYATTYNQRYVEEYATYSPTWTNYGGPDKIGVLRQEGNDKRDGKQTISSPTYRTTTFFSGQFDYTKAIGDHNIFAMLMANGWLRKFDGVYQATQNLNLGLQLSYNFRQKYYADISAAVPYSPKLPEGKRTAFSPVGTIGWRLTNEDFMSSQNIFDDLMLTVSGGVINTDLDIAADSREYFLYKAVIEQSTWWSWGDAHGQPLVAFRRGENLDLGFIKRKDINVGLRGSLLKKMFTFDANYFFSKMDGGLARVTSKYPSYFTQGWPESSLIPYVNYNIDDRSGIDFSVYFNQKAGDLSFQFGVSGMYLTTEVVKRDENYEFDYQTRMGRPLNQIWGLQNLGFFKDQSDIDNSLPQKFGAVKPGDFKYKDQNNDGIIDSNDEVYLGTWNSDLVLGLNLTLKWKNLSLFATGTGYFGGKTIKANDYYWSGRSDRKYSEMVRDRWTPETQNTATYPRLTTTNGSNNFRNSDFWVCNNNQFHLSSVHLTYDFPSTMLQGGFVKDLSVYIGGYNLLVLAEERAFFELNVGSAPQTRFFNFGIKATF